MTEPELPPLPSDLLGKLTNRESMTVDWKKSWATPDGIKDDMLEFSNAIGGQIFVGVEEGRGPDGERVPRFVGVDRGPVEKAQDDVRQWAASCDPPIAATVASYSHAGKRIDVVTVSPAGVKPVGRQGTYRIRRGNGGSALTTAELRAMFLGVENHKRALISEVEHNLKFLATLRADLSENRVRDSRLQTAAFEAVLGNGHLADYLNFPKLRDTLFEVDIVRRLIERFYVLRVIGDELPVERLKEYVPIVERHLTEYLDELQKA